MMQGKKILLGVTGSIAAYKTPELVRQLIKSGAEVKVILTPAATDFVSALSLSTVSKNNVYTSFYNDAKTSWHNHVELGLWCDVMLVAPASANTIAKFSSGICDNFLSAVYLSCRSQVVMAPAMDVDMYKHFTTQNNIELLKRNNILFIGPATGELASGLSGDGRMSEPHEIVSYLNNYFSNKLVLKGKKALVTAGPTFEAIDPVRFIGNHSSGKMGIAIASELKNRGADVTLVAGPNVQAHNLQSNIRVINVTSAADMLKACTKIYKASHITVMAAAVADFTPVTVANKKIKKGDNSNMNVELKATTDILAALGKQKQKNQLLVGFALETNNEIENATKKLKNKNLDFIVLNSMQDKNATFNSNQNKITIIDKSKKATAFPLKSKQEVAVDIVNKIVTLAK